MRSLTHEDERATIAVTVRAVNHRFLDLQLRCRSAFGDVEPRVRALLQKRLARGRVEIGISVQSRGAAAPTVELNRTSPGAVAAIEQRARRARVGRVDAGICCACRRRSRCATGRSKPILRSRRASPSSIEAAVEQALADLDAMRVAKASICAADLDARRQLLVELIEQLRVAADQGRGASRAACASGSRIGRAADRSGDDRAGDRPGRGAVGHLGGGHAVPRAPGALASLADADEPCGRKLDFLLQEMNREINTIGSKADGARISELIINAKAELETMREQVQNVE